ncbi:MAG: hypothetical protein ABFD18_06685 [Syntrophomonas sp.]
MDNKKAYDKNGIKIDREKTLSEDELTAVSGGEEPDARYWYAKCKNCGYEYGPTTRFNAYYMNLIPHLRNNPGHDGYLYNSYTNITLEL